MTVALTWELEGIAHDAPLPCTRISVTVADTGATPGRAIILYTTTIPLAEVRANLSRLIDEAVRTHERIEITRNGTRAAVVMSADDYDSLMETLDILADADVVGELRLALDELASGDVLTTDEVLADLPANRRGKR